MIKKHTSALTYIALIAPLFLLDLVLLFIFIDYFAISPEVSAVISFLISGVIGYTLERRIIFKRKNRTYHDGLFLYFCIVMVGAVIVYFGMIFFTKVFIVHFVLARMIVAMISGTWDYFMNFYFNFQMHTET